MYVLGFVSLALHEQNIARNYPQLVAQLCAGLSTVQLGSAPRYCTIRNRFSIPTLSVQTVNPASLTPYWWIRMVEANWVLLLLSDWSLSCFGSCRGWGSGQMALFLSASAPQGYKPLLFTMVATNLLCSINNNWCVTMIIRARHGVLSSGYRIFTPLSW